MRSTNPGSRQRDGDSRPARSDFVPPATQTLSVAYDGAPRDYYFLLLPNTTMLAFSAAVETLRVADGVPMIVATSWFEQARVPNFVADYADSGSITVALTRAGITDYRRKETRLTAELVEARDAQQLGLALGHRYC